MKAKRLTSLFCAVALLISSFAGLTITAGADGSTSRESVFEKNGQFGEHSVEITSVLNNIVQIKAVSEETEPFDAILIYVSYTDENFDFAKIYPVENISAEGIQKQLTDVAPQKGDKLMVWESLENIKPIADVYTIEEREPIITEYKITTPSAVTDLTIDDELADGEFSAQSGAVIAFKVTVPEGQRIASGGVTAVGVNSVDYNAATNVYSFLMPEQDTEIVVVFEDIPKNKIVFENPEGAYINVTAKTMPVISNSTDVEEGTEVSIDVIITDTIYQLTNLSYNDGTDHDIDITKEAPYTFIMPDKAVTITAVLAKKTVSSIELTAGEYAVRPGESATVTAKLWSAGNEEERVNLTDLYKNQIVWTIDDASMAAGASIVSIADADKAIVTAGTEQTTDIKVTAALGLISETTTIEVSEKEKYAITVLEIENGTVTTSPAGAALDGATITITAIPDEGYKLIEGSINVIKTNSGDSVAVTENTFIMPNEPVTVSASFEIKTNNIMVTPQKPTDNGTINVFEVINNNGVLSKGEALSLENVPYGTKFIVEVDAAEGYETDGEISILPEQTAVKDGDITYYTMPDAAVTLSALFKLKKYTVTFKSDGEIITTAEVQHNQTAETSKPENPVKAGYEFLGWVKGDSVDGDVIESWDQITEPVTYTAKFAKKAYTLTISEFENGIVKIRDAETNEEIAVQNSTVSIEYGTGFKIIAEGSDGYSLETLIVTYGIENNVLESIDGVYTMPADNVNIVVKFAKNLYTVTASVDEGVASVSLTDSDGIAKNGVISENTVTFEGLSTGEYTISATPKADYKDIIISAPNNKITVSEELTNAFAVTTTRKTNSKAEILEVQNGTIAVQNGDTILDAVSLASIQEGTVLTIDIKPDEGFELTGLEYSGTNADTMLNSVEITNTDGIYKFTMPAEPIKITAQFERIDRPKYNVENNAVVLSGAMTIQTVIIMNKEETNYYYMDTNSEGFIAERFLLDEPLAAGEYIIRTRMLDGTVSDAVLNVKAGN